MSEQTAGSGSATRSPLDGAVPQDEVGQPGGPVPSRPPPGDGWRRRRGKVDWGPYGRGPILLLSAVGLVDAIDKGILPGVLTRVQNDLGFSDFQLGMLEFAFVIATFLVIVPAGYLADRRRRTRIIAVVLGSWAVISAVTATVRNFIQFFTVRAALGVGETVDDPASQSLIADYYPARVRGRAYSYHRVTPTLGRALGTVLGALVASFFGWRAAFLLVGVPGSLLAIAIWRMREPERGEADLQDMSSEQDEADAASETEPRSPAAEPEGEDADGLSLREVFADLPKVFRIRSLRALLIGTAMASGALSGLGFWAVAFNERHSDLSGTTAAAVTGGMILTGAIVGTLVGGRVSDRVAKSHPGAPMVAAGLGTMLGGLALLISFADVPVWSARVPLQTAGVGLLVGAMPATFSMISQVASPAIRGQSFAATRFVASLVGAFSPPLIGLVADQYQITVGGEQVGNLALAFALFTPTLFLGGFYIYRGRVHVDGDREHARLETLALFGGDEVDVSSAPMLSIRQDRVVLALEPEVETGALPVPEGVPAPVAHGDGNGFGVDGVGPDLVADRMERASTWLHWLGIAVLVVGATAFGAAWKGAAGAAEVFDQVPFLISGALLGIALMGLGGVMAVLARVMRRAARRRRRAAHLEHAVEALRDTLRGKP